MAQCDTATVTKLKKAILNIRQYARGCRRPSEIIYKGFTHQMEENRDVEEDEVCRTLAHLIDEHVFSSASDYFDSVEPFQLEDIVISGSYSEGMQKIDLNTLSFSDTDFMLILKNIKVTEEDQRNGNLAVKQTSPFVTLYLTNRYLVEMWADFTETSNNERGERSTKLSPLKLKKRFREKYKNCEPMFIPLCNHNVKKVDEGPSIAVCYQAPDYEGPSLKGLPAFPNEEFDFVLAIKCDGWPLCAQAWLSRPRCWPSKDIVQTIVDGGFHIVCKSSAEGDFRLSYSNAETLLIQNLNDLQYKTYRAFKAFVNRYKKEWSPDAKKIICSYHLKTIMLWHCEKSDLKDWTEETVASHLLTLVDDLILALKEKTLAMYFMPKCNLMKQENNNTQIVEKITELRFNYCLIAEAIVAEEPDILDWINYFNIMFPGCLQIFSNGIAKGKFEPNDFLQYGKSLFENYDRFWSSTTDQAMPRKFELQFERGRDIFCEPLMKLLEKICKNVNGDL